MLQCTHRVCMAHLKSAKPRDRVTCPVCGDTTIVPDEGFGIDHALSLVIDVWREQLSKGPSTDLGSTTDTATTVVVAGEQAATTRTRPLCGLCEEKSATKRCVTCDGYLCDDCMKSHHSKALFKSHKVIDIDDDDAPKTEWESRMMCAEHPEEKLAFYCLDCRIPVCSHCLILGVHKGHQQTQIATAHQTGRETLQAWLEKLAERVNATEELSEKLKEASTEVQNGAEAQRNQINQEMDHLRDLIETKRAQLLSRSALEEKQKRVQLQGQQERTSAVKADVVKLMERSRGMLALSSEHAFLTLVLPLIQDMKKCCGQAVETGPSVPLTYRPLSTDAQVRCLGDLDLGQIRMQAGGAASSAAALLLQQQPGLPPPGNSAGHATVSFLPQPALVAAPGGNMQDMALSPVQHAHLHHAAGFSPVAAAAAAQLAQAPAALAAHLQAPLAQGVPVHQVQYVYRAMQT